MRLTLMTAAGLSAAAIALWPAEAEAQRPTRGRAPTIEIRGQVPTPQVVTVRPREVPDFSRAVLVPRFYDRHFWTVITLAYQIVPRSTVTGSALDTITLVSTPAGGGAPGIGVETPTAPRGDTAMAPSPTLSNDAELAAIRRELQLRRARLDSIAAKVKGLGEARDTTERRPLPPPQTPAPADTSRRQPPTGQPGTASARSRR